jgi:histidinol dehydrogenase
MDLFSQAEHDEQAQSILIATSSAALDAVQASMERLLPEMERRAIIETSLTTRGLFVLVEDLDAAARVSNAIAPEHLELSVADPQSLLEKIEHAGAIFMGRHCAEALGDYCAGPSHVLPTSGTARFFSALGVYDFQKRSSIIFSSKQGASTLAKTVVELARNEHLQAHGLSASYRE